MRVRLRHALSRIVRSIHCVFYAVKNSHRVAAVRLDFEGGKHRDYAIAAVPRHVSNGGKERPAVGLFSRSPMPDSRSSTSASRPTR